MSQIQRASIAIVVYVAGLTVLVLGCPLNKLNWFGAALVILGILACIPCLVVWATGYRAMPDTRVEQLRHQAVWHLTAEPIHSGDYIALDASRCRWRSLVWRRDAWWKRPRRAVFMFTGAPTELDRQLNVASDRATYRYELDGADLPHHLLGRDSAIAVPASLRVRVISHRWVHPQR